MKQATVWLIGDFSSAEFTFAVEGLATRACVQHFATVDEALRRTAAAESPGQQPEIVVIAQNRPGEVSASAVERLHAAHPLSRLIMLLSAWCEGEMRTGFPVAGIARMFWHAFPTQMGRLLHELASGRSAPWAFPRIAGQQERFLQEIPAQRLEPSHAVRGSLLIRAANLTAFDILAEALRPQSPSCHWLDLRQLVRFRSADCIVWDAPELTAAEWHDLARCRSTQPTTAMVLLTSFPRATDLQRATDLGVQTLIAKPFLVADLATAVRECLLPVPSVGMQSQPVGYALA